MSKNSVVLMPRTQKYLEQMGEQIKLARLRRRLSASLVSERAKISRQTLNSIEKGSSTVSIGAYASVLHALHNMDSDLLYIARDDELGRKLQDLGLPSRKRAPRKGEQ
ncbi:MAG TPA: helix-turn-helix transcriptional regulator [Clostridia bacterium]|nr:helix-turn-helix transcriptional regulator [Clostridia bacterium]